MYRLISYLTLLASMIIFCSCQPQSNQKKRAKDQGSSSSLGTNSDRSPASTSSSSAKTFLGFAGSGADPHLALLAFEELKSRNSDITGLEEKFIHRCPVLQRSGQVEMAYAIPFKARIDSPIIECFVNESSDTFRLKTVDGYKYVYFGGMMGSAASFDSNGTFIENFNYNNPFTDDYSCPSGFTKYVGNPGAYFMDYSFHYCLSVQSTPDPLKAKYKYGGVVANPSQCPVGFQSSQFTGSIGAPGWMRNINEDKLDPDLFFCYDIEEQPGASGILASHIIGLEGNRGSCSNQIMNLGSTETVSLQDYTRHSIVTDIQIDGEEVTGVQDIDAIVYFNLTGDNGYSFSNAGETWSPYAIVGDGQDPEGCYALPDRLTVGIYDLVVTLKSDAGILIDQKAYSFSVQDSGNPGGDDTTAPSIPTGLQISSSSSSSLCTQWNASIDLDIPGQSASGVKDYEITATQVSNASNTSVQRTASTATCFAGLTANTLYDFRVRAYDNAGNRSNYSSAVRGLTEDDDGSTGSGGTGFERGRQIYFNDLNNPQLGQYDNEGVFHKMLGNNAIYASAQGSDSNDGLSMSTPVRTMQKAFDRALNQINDGNNINAILFRKGDTFNSLAKPCYKCFGSGANNLFYVSNYHENSSLFQTLPRPKLIIPQGEKGIKVTKVGEASNIAWMGLHIECELKGDDVKIFEFHKQANIIFEDNLLKNCREGIIVKDTSSNIQIEFNVITGMGTNHTTSKWGMRSQGAYVSNVDGLLVNSNVVDYNGKRYGLPLMAQGNGHMGDVFSHNLYLSSNIEDAVITNNIISRATSHGIQLRSGGYIEGNVFYKNALHLLVGEEDPSHIKTNNGRVKDNIFIDSIDMGDNQSIYHNTCDHSPRFEITVGSGAASSNICGRGVAIDFNGTFGYKVTDNIFAHRDLSARNAKYAVIRIAHGTSSLTVQNNKILNWEVDTDEFPQHSSNRILNSSSITEYTLESYAREVLGNNRDYDDFINDLTNSQAADWNEDLSADKVVGRVKQVYSSY